MADRQNTRPVRIATSSRLIQNASAGGAMQFGIFDQNDRGPSPLAEQYENRLKLIEFYDRAGFRAYHMSEHHSTPLNLTPSPSVFLAAAAQRTRRLRLGALVYILPAHHPLRLAEEICMLDHLSHGRLEVGVGRGASPHELQYFGVDPETAPAMYVEAYTVIRQALTQKLVNFSGKYYNFENVPVEIKPAQLPHPPFWYACRCRRARCGRRKTTSISFAPGRCQKFARSPIATAPNRRRRAIRPTISPCS